MTSSNFKNWFEGFCENLKGPPNSEQWKRIKARVKEIDETPVTRDVFIDRYVNPYRIWWHSDKYLATNAGELNSPVEETKIWCSAGKAEFASLAK